MAHEKILIVEDEEEIRELVAYNLVKQGYRAIPVGTGEEGLRRVQAEKPDLIVLDLMLPGVDGLEVCRSLKRDPTTESIPVVMLTAKGEEADIVAGLELGADDYLTKPFSPRVLLARIRAVLRRKAEEPLDEMEVLRSHGLTIHSGRHEVLVEGKSIPLTATEFRVLYLLVQRSGWVFTRDQITNAIHGEDNVVTDRSVDVQIVGLRKKLGKAAAFIETIRGVGYRFKEQ
jgi:two-component system phosphate regulon response regulator PhoB